MAGWLSSPVAQALAAAVLLGISFVPYRAGMQHISYASYYLILGVLALGFCLFFFITSGGQWGAASVERPNVPWGFLLVSGSNFIFLTGIVFLNNANASSGSSVALISAFAATNPVWATIVGKFFLHESVSALMGIGMALILGGIFCVAYSIRG